MLGLGSRTFKHRVAVMVVVCVEDLPTELKMLRVALQAEIPSWLGWSWPGCMGAV